MPLFPGTIKVFRLVAIRANGTPVSGATVRILDSTGSDVSAGFFGAGVPNEPITDNYGTVRKLFLQDLPLLPAGIYTIQVIAAGFDLWEYETEPTFYGAIDLVANLERASVVSGAYTLTPPPNAYASAFYPIDAQVESGASDLAWELIRFLIVHSDSRQSVLEAPVSESIAQADLHSRVRLHPRPNLVPDGQTALVDPDFSDQLTVTLESLNPEGTQSIPGGFGFSVANMIPLSGGNDLSAYTLGSNLPQIKWITLLSEPVVFRGFYQDVMIWLIDVSADYVLHTRYLDGAGDQVGDEEETELSGNLKVQRIRLNSLPDVSVRSAELWITKEEDIISETLTVRYRG